MANTKQMWFFVRLFNYATNEWIELLTNQVFQRSLAKCMNPMGGEGGSWSTFGLVFSNQQIGTYKFNR